MRPTRELQRTLTAVLVTVGIVTASVPVASASRAAIRGSIALRSIGARFAMVRRSVHLVIPCWRMRPDRAALVVVERVRRARPRQPELHRFRMQRRRNRPRRSTSPACDAVLTALASSHASTPTSPTSKNPSDRTTVGAFRTRCDGRRQRLAAEASRTDIELSRRARAIGAGAAREHGIG